MTEPTTEQRCAWARASLQTYTGESDRRDFDPLCDEDKQAAMTDLGASLLHLGQRMGLSPTALAQSMVDAYMGDLEQTVELTRHSSAVRSRTAQGWRR